MFHFDKTRATGVVCGIFVVVMCAVLGTNYLERSEEQTGAVVHAIESPMTPVLKQIFDSTDPRIAYDWIELPNHSLVEESAFATEEGAIYSFILTTQKVSPEAARYTIPHNLVLTRTIPTGGGVDEIEYTDMDADGSLELLRYNGTVVTEDELITLGREEYARELVAIYEYLRE